MAYKLDQVINLINECFHDEDSFNQFIFSYFEDIYNTVQNVNPLSTKILKFVQEVNIKREILKLLLKLDESEDFHNIFEEYKNKILPSRKSQISYDKYKSISQLIQKLEQNFIVGELQTIYSSCRPQEANAVVTNIDEMVTQLDRIFSPNSYSPLILFLAKVKKNFVDLNKLLDSWFQQYGRHFGYDNFLKEVNPISVSTSSTPDNSVNLSEASLLIEIKKLNPNYLQIQAWFWTSKMCRPIQEKDIIEIYPEQSDLNAKYKNIANKFTEFIRKTNLYMNKVGSKNLRIELFIPNKLLQESDFYIDWLKIERLGFLEEMCKQYVVVFRLAERLGVEYQDLKKDWENYWQRINLNAPLLVDYSPTAEHQLRQSQTIGIKLDTVANYENFFKLICLKALPVALWSRCDLQTSPCLQQINTILANVGDNFRQLPEVIRNQRIDATPGTEHIGHHICLLWDDPDRMPSDPQKPENALTSI